MSKPDKKEKKEKKEKKRNRSSDEDERTHKEHRKSQRKAEKVAKAFGYSNDINPFGDSNLLKPFVWGKKQDKEMKEGKSVADPDEERLRLMADIERVRKRRHDREVEVEEMERLRTEEQRLREAAQYGDWMKKEEEYHVDQTKVRSKIRLMEGREKPVDVLAKNIILIEEFQKSMDKKSRADAVALARLRVEVDDPLDALESGGMAVGDLDQFIADADNYLQLEMRKRSVTGACLISKSLCLLAAASDATLAVGKVNGSEHDDYVSFWQGLKDIAAGERRKRRQNELSDVSSRGSHRLVEADVKRIFAQKTAPELEQLNKEILVGVHNGSRADVEYWEAVAAEALLEAARIVVRDRYAEILTRQLDILNELQDEISTSEEQARSGRGTDGRVTEGSDFRFLSSASGVGRIKTTDNDNDRAQLGTGGDVDSSAVSLEMERSEAEKFIPGDAEEKMAKTDEVALPGRDYHWKDEYRPRKPRYFNRVRLGYDWNKYNSTHYDFDNPPPKLVLGYKFNIFYPDLVDKASTPKYFIEKCDEPGYSVLRFHVGPPYEDIAFKVVSKQWETNQRSGFRCIFERGVLQLHFNLKRHWYRR